MAKLRKYTINNIPEDDDLLFCVHCGETENFRIVFYESRNYLVRATCSKDTMNEDNYEDEPVNEMNWDRSDNVYHCGNCSNLVSQKTQIEIIDIMCRHVDKNMRWHDNEIPETTCNSKLKEMYLALKL